MLNLPPLLHNHRVQQILGVAMGILILTLLLPPDLPQPISQDIFPSPSSTSLINNSSTFPKYFSRSRLTSFSSPFPFKSGQIPIYLGDIPTSPGITTALNIYSFPADPPQTLRFEIYGPSYQGSDLNEVNNPNLVAYRETFARGLSLLVEHGLDPSQYQFIYSSTPHIQSIASSWVIKYQLLP